MTTTRISGFYRKTPQERLGQFADFFKSASGLIFTLAAVLIAYFSKGKWVSIAMIIPFAFFIRSLDQFSFQIVEKHLSISFFLGIAIGPMFYDLLLSMSSSARGGLIRNSPKEYHLATESTYIAEAIIPLLAFGIPLSPVALGPAAPLFNAPPVFTSDPVNNLHNLLTPWDFFLYGLIGLVIATAIAYPFAMNYARTATVFVMKNISQEAIVGMFVGLACLLAFHEAQLVGVMLALTVATLGGLLNRVLGVGAGVQFMIFYGSTYMMTTLLGA